MSPPAPTLAAPFDSELALLAAGVKRVIKMEFAEPDRVARAVTLGFTARQADGRYGVTSASADITYDAGQATTVFVGRDIDVKRAVEVEVIERGTTGETRLEAMREMGALLGYPACCTAAYSEQEDQGESASFARLLGAGPQNHGTFPNNLFVLEHQLISHFPCTLSCAQSEAVAKAALDACRKEHPDYSVDLEALLRSEIQVWDRFRFLIAHPEGRRHARHISSFRRVLDHPSFRAFEAGLPAVPEGGVTLSWT